MKTPRRRVLRPAAPIASETERRHLATFRRYEARLTVEQTALRRWMKRLKRSFTAVDKLQRSISRIERQLSLLRQDSSLPAR